MKKIYVIISVIMIAVAVACSDDSDSNSGDTTIGEQRANLLISWADDFIIPQFETFLLDTEALVEAKNSFITEPNEVNLINLRTALTTAYISFQPAAAYANIGKGEELNYYLNLNAHALDVDEALVNINEFSTVDLSLTSQQDAQGLPAVDYLVNGLGDTDADIVAFYTDNQAENYLGYLSIVVDRIENLTQQVVDDWNNGYRETFIENQSSSSSGSFDIFVNVYVEYFERRIRTSKVGIPSGALSQSLSISPDEIESLYNPTLSKELLVVALDNAENLYTGLPGSEVSLSVVLVDLGFEELDALLKTFFDEAQTQIDEDLPDDLRSQILTDNTVMTTTRDKLQNIVRNFKADFASALGVDITTPDNDGD